MSSKTHDYTTPCWGHDYCIDSIENKGINIKLTGWGHNIDLNDFLILRNGSNNTRYKVTSIRYYLDPPDMWSANAIFAPRE